MNTFQQKLIHFVYIYVYIHRNDMDERDATMNNDTWEWGLGNEVRVRERVN